MYNGGYNSKNPFPHDGEHGRNCTGYGCDCDEKNYGGFHPRSTGSTGLILLISIILIFIGIILK